MNHRWSASDMRIIIYNPMLSDRQLAQLIGIKSNQVKKFRERYGLKKSEKFMHMVRSNNLAMGGGRPLLCDKKPRKLP